MAQNLQLEKAVATFSGRVELGDAILIVDGKAIGVVAHDAEAEAACLKLLRDLQGEPCTSAMVASTLGLDSRTASMALCSLATVHKTAEVVNRSVAPFLYRCSDFSERKP